MTQAILNFPRGFIWGTASAAYPVEGNHINNNWYAWEQAGQVSEGQTCGLACDWWGGRWREDFDRAAESGQTAHRLTIEWSRIQPSANRWDEDALDYYRQMLRGLIERSLTPMVTLHHFTEPLWVVELGSWQNEAIVEHFETFTRRTVEALQEYANWWCTLNAPNLLAVQAYLRGQFPPGKQRINAAYKAITNMIKGHAAAYQAIHEIQPSARVGLAHQYRGFQAEKSYLGLNRGAANRLSRNFNEAIPRALADGTLRLLGTRKRLPAAKGTQDFFGLNYYSSENVAFNLWAPGELFAKRFYPPAADLSPTGAIANAPDGFFQALKWARGFGLPIVVTGNGTEDPGDDFRPRYLIAHLHKLWHAVNRSWRVQGYFYDTLVDSFAWDRGWTQRFGLWELNTANQERRKRTSADLFTIVCQKNALTTEDVNKYAPELLKKLFPD